jgi:hypothetical protein
VILRGFFGTDQSVVLPRIPCQSAVQNFGIQGLQASLAGVSGADYDPPPIAPDRRFWQSCPDFAAIVIRTQTKRLSGCFSLISGAVAKWLRQRIANPSFPGSNPGGASSNRSVPGVWG